MRDAMNITHVLCVESGCHAISITLDTPGNQKFECEQLSSVGFLLLCSERYLRSERFLVVYEAETRLAHAIKFGNDGVLRSLYRHFVIAPYGAAPLPRSPVGRESL